MDARADLEAAVLALLEEGWTLGDVLMAVGEIAGAPVLEVPVEGGAPLRVMLNVELEGVDPAGTIEVLNRVAALAAGEAPRLLESAEGNEPDTGGDGAAGG